MARIFLVNLLDGKEDGLTSAKIKEAAKKEGIAWMTVLRAKKELGVFSKRVPRKHKGGVKHWVWILPPSW
jgi:hypothetical protein